MDEHDRTEAAEQRVTVNRGSGRHRLTAWREAMGATATIQIDPAIVARFEGEFRSRIIGPLMAVRIRSDTFRFIRDEEMAGRIGRDNVFINLFERGQLVGVSNGRQVSVGPGDVILSRHGDTQDLEVRDATWLGLVLPLDLIERQLRWTRALDGKVFAAGTTEAVLLGHHLRAVAALPDPASDRDAKRLVRLTMSLLIECLGTRGPIQSTAKQAKSVDAAAIRRFIAENIGNRQLGLDLVCKEFSVSRSSLYRMLDESGGIQALILSMRLRAVHRDIGSGRFLDQALGTIAERRGVADIRSFRRAFVKEFGYTPSDLRARSSGEDALTKWPHAEAIADIERWFEA